MPGFAWFLTCIKTTFIPPTSLFLENIFGIFAFLGGLVAPHVAATAYSGADGAGYCPSTDLYCF
jgi:hypothetical protein